VDADQPAVDWVLHRSNTAERIRDGIAAGFDRLEIDVWYKRGELRLSHDPSVGRFVVGPNGVALGAPPGPRRWLSVVRVVGSHLTLPDVAGSPSALPSLVLDLKGRWPAAGLERLAALRQESPDAVVCWDVATIERYAGLRPGVLPMYAERQATGPLLERFRRAAAEGKPVAVSARAQTLLGGEGGPLLATWRDAGLRIYVWDVPDLDALRRVLRLGIDGAIVHEPAWIGAVAA